MKNCLRYSLFCITLLLLGCKREECTEPAAIVETIANLLWTGDYAVDGCGFRVQIGEQFYKPENEEDIDASFRTNESFPYPSSRSIKLRYLPRGNRLDVSCGMQPATKNIDYIYVLSIERL
jgi:hypothetical protein